MLAKYLAQTEALVREKTTKEAKTELQKEGVPEERPKAIVQNKLRTTT